MIVSARPYVPEDSVPNRVVKLFQILMREAGERLAVKTLAERMNDPHGELLGEEVTPRWVGGILRKLGMRTRKSRGLT